MAGRNRISRSLVSRFQDRSCALGGSKIEVGRLNLFGPPATNWLIATGQHAPPIPAVQSRVLAAVPPTLPTQTPSAPPAGFLVFGPRRLATCSTYAAVPGRCSPRRSRPSGPTASLGSLLQPLSGWLSAARHSWTGAVGGIAVIPSSWSQFQAHPRMLRPVRSKAGLGSLGSALRRCLPTTASPFKAMDRRPARPDSRMSSFHEFLSAAADFALTLNLKAAIVAAGFIVMLMLTRRRGAK